MGIDEVVNYIDRTGNESSYVDKFVSESQKDLMVKVLQQVDFAVVPSEAIQNAYSKFNAQCFCIEDMVYDEFFKRRKRHTNNKKLQLLYSGSAVKASELNLISAVLQRLHVKYAVELLLITDEDPGLDIIPYSYIKYDQRIIANQMLQGDIKLAPRDLSNAYNMGHSSLKIAYPMSLGIPSVASPVPSYYNTGAILVSGWNHWDRTLSELIENPNKRQFSGNEACIKLKNRLSEDFIIKRYEKLFKYLTNQ